MIKRNNQFTPIIDFLSTKLKKIKNKLEQQESTEYGNDVCSNTTACPNKKSYGNHRMSFLNEEKISQEFFLQKEEEIFCNHLIGNQNLSLAKPW